MAITSRGAILQTIPTRFRFSVFEYLMLPREFLRIEGAVQTNDHIFRTKSREYTAGGFCMRRAYSGVLGSGCDPDYCLRIDGA